MRLFKKLRLLRRMLLPVGLVFGALFAACLANAAGAGAVRDAVLTISTADGELEADGQVLRIGPVDLGRRWDTEFAGLGGRAVYRIMLPEKRDLEPMALLFSRVGNQVHVQVNGNTVARWGVLGEPRFDAAKHPLMLLLPAALLHADRANELRVEVTIQAQRLGGLSVLRYGPHRAIEALYDGQRRWRESPMLAYAAGLVGMGALTGLLWWRLRDALYGWFSLAALLGAVRFVDRLWPDVPLPWPYLGAFAAVCYVCHVALLCRISLMMLGPVSGRMNRAIDVVIVLASVLATLSFALGRPLLLTLAYMTLPAIGLVLLVTLLETLRRAVLNPDAKNNGAPDLLQGPPRPTRRRWPRPRRKTAWVVAASVAVALAAGVYDVVLIRLAGANGLRTTMSHHALFVFVLLMGGLLAERYSRAVEDHRALNADLARRVEERERQLREAFEAMRAQQHEQSVQAERERIMREIHDGVGSQLVGLLNMVTRPGADPMQLQEQVQQALDEMRMAVDSLQPVHDDLVTVLATLRYRLQPRLQAAGIVVVWDVAELPALAQLSPHAVLQVQRILLEAFTNVLKHARATQVVVQARWQDGAAALVTLQIADNGVGLRAEGDTQRSGHPGRGIQNMRARATAIGALLRVEPTAGGGVCVALDWPLEPEPGSPGKSGKPGQAGI